MRGLATCYSDHAIKVSDSYCSSRSSTNNYNNNNIYVSPSFIPSIQDEVSVTYKVKLSTTQNLLFITLTWSTHNVDFPLIITTTTINMNNEPDTRRCFCLKHMIKGSRKIDHHGSKVELFWDLTKATYEMGPRPVKGYFVAVLVNDSEMASFGDTNEDDIEDLEFKKLLSLGGYRPFAKCSLVSRNERFSGNSEYSTRAKFFDTGTWHDIMITCLADDGRKSTNNYNNNNNSSLSLCVTIDKKNVIDMKRLRWNFRGNQTVFLDGMLVDLMWDVHDWFFGSDYLNSGTKPRSRTSRDGIFLFRPRGESNGRLWLQENINLWDDYDDDYSLLICACKNPD